MRKVIYTGMLAALLAGPLPAADKARDKPKASSPTASKTTFLKLMQVQELWEEERYDEAIADLEKLTERVEKSPYDFALANQYLAHTSILAGQPGRARRALESALAMSEIPLGLLAELKLFYGQIMLGEEEFAVAREMFDDWLATTESEPQPAHLFSAAYANYRTENLPGAENLVVRAIAAEPKPKDNWDRLHYQVLFEQQKYAEAEDVLMAMITRSPDDAGHWNMLSNHFLQQEDSARALAAMVISYQQELVDKPSELQRMVSLYSYIEVPEKAARMLQTWIDAGDVEQTPETLRQLGDLWLLAREREEAKTVLTEAAAVAPDGRTYELLGSIYFEDEDWEDAHEAFVKALDLGGLEEAHHVALLAGISAYRAGMAAEARVALEQAAESKELRAQARGLLKRLDDA